MKKKALLRITALLAAAVLAACVFVQAKGGASVDYGEKLDTLAGLISELHINADPDEDPIRRGLLKMFEEYPGTFEAFANIMYQSYDPYSYYAEPGLYEQAYAPVSEQAGVGITIEAREDGCYIDSVTAGGPAEGAGVRAGDKLLAVDGKRVEGYTPTMIGDLVLGREGSTVRLTLLREGEQVSAQMQRVPIASPRVTFEDMGDGVAYIRLRDFAGYTTYLSFCGYYDYLEEMGYKSVILDLRDNPGGDLDCLINMMDAIVPDKDMPYLMVRGDKNRSINTYTTEGYGWDFCGMTVLVNENTGSAAEIMAGALQDLGYAQVVGVQTMGKGLGQAHVKLDDGSYAVVSTHEMFLPVTGAYTGRGIRPMHYVENQKSTRTNPDFDTLDLNMGVYRSMEKNVRAVEQRLKKMGYFDGTVDNVADEKTFHAINMFQRDHGIEMSDGRCDSATVRAINSAYIDFVAQPEVKDSQLEKAVAIARAAAKAGKTPTPIDPKTVRFSGK